jgi:hypothetical protein
VAHNSFMNLELLLIVLIVALLAGCGARGNSNESRISSEKLIPAAEKARPEAPRPAYGLPLVIRVELPEVPKEIQGPSPPIPPGTPMPGGIFMDSAQKK